MQIRTNQKPFVHTIIDDYFDKEELPSVFSEIKYLNQQFIYQKRQELFIIHQILMQKK